MNRKRWLLLAILLASLLAVVLDGYAFDQAGGVTSGYVSVK